MNAPILHRNFERDRELAAQIASSAEPGSFLFLVGPSGVGKTVMEPWIIRQIAGNATNWLPGSLPAIVVRATRSSRGYFSSKDFQTRLNIELRDPNLDWLESASDVDRRVIDAIREYKMECSRVWKELKLSRSESALRLEFVRQARARSVKWIVVRDGAAMCGTQERKNPSDYIMSCMELAEETNTVWIIIGVARMAKLWQQHGEVRRRSIIVPIQRYLDTPDDRSAFAQVVKKVAAGYKVSPSARIWKRLDDIYTTTGGCFGQVKEYFRRADVLRRRSNEEEISEKHFSEAFYGDADMRTLWSELQDFDRLVVPASPRSFDESVVGGAY